MTKFLFARRPGKISSSGYGGRINLVYTSDKTKLREMIHNTMSHHFSNIKTVWDKNWGNVIDSGDWVGWQERDVQTPVLNSKQTKWCNLQPLARISDLFISSNYQHFLFFWYFPVRTQCKNITPNYSLAGRRKIPREAPV